MPQMRGQCQSFYYKTMHEWWILIMQGKRKLMRPTFSRFLDFCSSLVRISGWYQSYKVFHIENCLVVNSMVSHHFALVTSCTQFVDRLLNNTLRLKLAFPNAQNYLRVEIHQILNCSQNVETPIPLDFVFFNSLIEYILNVVVTLHSPNGNMFH